ncbi:MAG: iron(III) transport system substrate-binding protein [Woeseiaceae bacterium]|jgi:iron(III) transport system substrate-binding protein|tara:strand:- start:610 stop:1641 length:1032 start_codon:yes stop_codon:yes gene_type:complete
MSKLQKLMTILYIVIFSLSSAFAEEVNVYTSRHYDSDDALYSEFTKETGIKVNIISGNGSALIERLKVEGKNSPADIYFTVDAGNLWKVQKDGYFKSINSESIKSVVPKNLRGPNDEWVAIAKRARVIYYNPNTVTANEVNNLSYEDLARPEWKERIAIRSSSNMYNQSLVASLISNHGIQTTESWAKDFVKNFARNPQGSDRAQIVAVANGEADIAIANSYYIGIMLSGGSGDDQLQAAKKVKMHFPNQGNRGVHINISGAGVLKNSPNSENAIKFIEFLLSKKVQQYMVNISFEYPVIDGIDPHPSIANFGTDFKEDRTSVADYGKYNPDAIRLMDRAGWK